MSTVVCAFSDLAPDSATRFVVHGTAVAVIRLGDDVYALGDACSHGDVSLSEGEVLCDSKEIECWKHGSAFSVETGVPSTLPAIKPVPVFAASVVDGMVTISVGQDSTTDSTDSDATNQVTS